MWFWFSFVCVGFFSSLLTPRTLSWITFAKCGALSLLLFWNKTAFEDRNHCAVWTFKQGMTYFLASVLSATSFLLPRATKRVLGREVLGNLSWGWAGTLSFYLLVFLLRHRVNTFPYWSLTFTPRILFPFQLLWLNRHEDAKEMCYLSYMSTFGGGGDNQIYLLSYVISGLLFG